MYRAHWRHLVSIAFVVYALLALFTLLLVVLLDELGVFVAKFVDFAGVFWVQGALVTAVEDVRDGRADLTVRETLERVRPQLNRLSFAALGILAGTVAAAFLIVLGFVLFVVPGVVAIGVLVVFAVRWSLLVPVIMLEGRTVFGSLDRSQELVRGNSWQVALVLVGSIAFVVAVAIVVGLALTPLADWLSNALGTVVAGSIGAPFAALALTLAYYRLRRAPEPAPTPAVA